MTSNVFLGLAFLLTINGVVHCAVLSFLSTEVGHLGGCYLNNTEFMNKFNRRAQSLDSFLSLIEKIENNTFYGSKSYDILSKALITRFRVDGIYKTPWNSLVPFHQRTEHSSKLRFVKRVLEIPEEFKNWALPFNSLDDICSLHWMLSHSINMTIRGDENFSNLTPPPHLKERRKRAQPYITGYNQDTGITHYPVETGVIQTPYGTVAIGSVLAGLAVGDPSSEIRLSQAAFLELEEKFRDLKLKKVYGATFGGYLAAAYEKSVLNTPGESVLGPRGWWNCSFCPVEYTLVHNATWCTDAEMLGALDGYFLAKGLDRMPEKNTMKLSQILRMYYGNGFPLNRDIRACERLNKLQIELQTSASKTEMEHAVTYCILATQTISVLDGADTLAKRLIQYLGQNYTSARFPYTQKCFSTDVKKEKEPEPLVDLYMVVEAAYYRSDALFEEHASLVGELANVMDVAQHASHMGIYMNNLKYFNQLFPLNATKPEAELKCEYKRLPISKMSITSTGESQIQIIRELDKLFRDIRLAEESLRITGSPRKVLLFMQMNSPGDRSVIEWEMMHFRRQHPDVVILGVGRMFDHLESFVKRTREDFIQEGGGQTKMEAATRIYDRLKKVGAALYFPYCTKKQTQTYSYQGFVSPFNSRFHTLNSNQFNTSEELVIKISSGMRLRVCHSRSLDIFKTPFQYGTIPCQNVDVTGAYTAITIPKPCAAGGEVCDDLHLMVEALDSDEQPSRISCTDPSCRTFDTIRYTIVLENARCGRSATIVAHLGLILVLLIVVSKYTL